MSHEGQDLDSQLWHLHWLPSILPLVTTVLRTCQLHECPVETAKLIINNDKLMPRPVAEHKQIKYRVSAVGNHAEFEEPVKFVAGLNGRITQCEIRSLVCRFHMAVKP